MENKNHRIAIFGGTFDPPHKGHFQLATKILQENFADEVMFIPALYPPHKSEIKRSHFDDREKMIQLSIKHCKNPSFSLNTLEGERHNSPSYTLDTMVELAKTYPKAELILLLGEDSLMNLHTWYNATMLVENWKILTYPRKNYTTQPVNTNLTTDSKKFTELSNFWHAEMASKLIETILPFEIYNISSTEIREKIKNGEDVNDMLFYEIVEYIITGRTIEMTLRHDIKEDLYINSYYGMQSAYNTTQQKKIYMPNSQHHDELDMENYIYSGMLSDYPSVNKVIHSNLDKSICQELFLNPNEGLFLKTTNYISSLTSFSRIFTKVLKTYFNQIRFKNVVRNDSYYWKGSYSWYDLNEYELPQPKNITIDHIGTNIVKYDNVVGATLYHIYRSLDPYSGFVEIGTSTTLSYQDIDISESNMYFYRVTAENELVNKSNLIEK